MLITLAVAFSKSPFTLAPRRPKKADVTKNMAASVRSSSFDHSSKDWESKSALPYASADLTSGALWLGVKGATGPRAPALW